MWLCKCWSQKKKSTFMICKKLTFTRQSTRIISSLANTYSRHISDYSSSVKNMVTHHKITPFIYHDKMATGGEEMRRNVNMRMNPSGGKYTLVLLLSKRFTCARFYTNCLTKWNMWLNFPATDKVPGKEMLREYNTFICLKSNKL